MFAECELASMLSSKDFPRPCEPLDAVERRDRIVTQEDGPQGNIVRNVCNS